MNSHFLSKGIWSQRITVGTMAYVPPHKRHSLDKGRPSLKSEFLAPQFERNLNLRSQDSRKDKRGKIVYADYATYGWFSVGLNDNDQLPSHIHLMPVSIESIERRFGEKPLVLVNSHLIEENNQLRGDGLLSPWAIIAGNVKQDLLTSFERLRDEMQLEHLELVKPTLVARFGKILFHGNPLVNVQGDQFDESVLKQLKRSIYTNIPASYKEYIIDEVVPKIGFTFEDEKEIYHVRLSDSSRPDSILSCKCRLQADKKLLLYKVELNQVRQMVTDIACLTKNLDLRLMLCTKRILTALTDEEVRNIRLLVDSAVLDVEVKGGLKWPLGKSSSGNRFRVVGVWHSAAKAYNCPSLRLKVRQTDRYDFGTGTGENTGEVLLKLKGFVSEMLEKGAESDAAFTMLWDNLRLIWEHFLRSEPIV